MPNIEVHGCGVDADSVRNAIFRNLNGRPYIKDVVVTIFPSDVRDHEGTTQPYLRICNTAKDQSKQNVEILAALVPLHMDMEVLTLAKFIPKQKW